MKTTLISEKSINKNFDFYVGKIDSCAHAHANSFCFCVKSPAPAGFDLLPLEGNAVAFREQASFRFMTQPRRTTRELKAWLWEQYNSNPEFKRSIHRFRGKTLACWCKQPSCAGQAVLALVTYIDEVLIPQMALDFDKKNTQAVRSFLQDGDPEFAQSIIDNFDAYSTGTDEDFAFVYDDNSYRCDHCEQNRGEITKAELTKIQHHVQLVMDRKAPNPEKLATVNTWTKSAIKALKAKVATLTRRTIDAIEAGDATRAASLATESVHTAWPLTYDPKPRLGLGRVPAVIKGFPCIECGRIPNHAKRADRWEGEDQNYLDIKDAVGIGFTVDSIASTAPDSEAWADILEHREEIKAAFSDRESTTAPDTHLRDETEVRDDIAAIVSRYIPADVDQELLQAQAEAARILGIANVHRAERHATYTERHAR